MPFGWGGRNCLGAQFAMQELKCIIVSLFSCYDVIPKTNFPLTPGNDIPLEYSGTIKPAGNIEIQLVPAPHPIEIQRIVSKKTLASQEKTEQEPPKCPHLGHHLRARL